MHLQVAANLLWVVTLCTAIVCPPLNAPAPLAALPPRDLDHNLQKRTADDVLNRMAIVATGLITTTAAVNTLQPNDIANTVRVGNIAEQALVLAQHVRDVIATANASAPYTSARDSECQARANIYHFGLITNMTDALVAKKSSWATALLKQGDVSLTIKNAILTENNLVAGPGGFSEAVMRKSRPGTATPERDMGPFFHKAAAHFDKCTGKICLPPFIPVMQAYSLPGVPFSTG